MMFLEKLLKKEEEEDSEKFSEKFMIRSCIDYNDEFYNCDGYKSRFHQYFIHGFYFDCYPWLMDYENCLKWDKNRDEEAYKQLIKSEKLRRLQRLKPHYQNDVWKRREKPPENWDAPLPDWLEKKNKNSFLELKAKEIKEGKVNDIEMKIYSACPIL